MRLESLGAVYIYIYTGSIIKIKNKKNIDINRGVLCQNVDRHN